jgi:hypothetical protein
MHSVTSSQPQKSTSSNKSWWQPAAGRRREEQWLVVLDAGGYCFGKLFLTSQKSNSNPVTAKLLQ